MNRSKSIAILAFLVGIGGGLVLRLWASGMAVDIVGPHQLQVLVLALGFLMLANRRDRA